VIGSLRSASKPNQVCWIDNGLLVRFSISRIIQFSSAAEATRSTRSRAERISLVISEWFASGRAIG